MSFVNSERRGPWGTIMFEKIGSWMIPENGIKVDIPIQLACKCGPRRHPVELLSVGRNNAALNSIAVEDLALPVLVVG